MAAAELVIEGPAGAHDVVIPTEMAFLLVVEEHCQVDLQSRGGRMSVAGKKQRHLHCTWSIQGWE